MCNFLGGVHGYMAWISNKDMDRTVTFLKMNFTSDDMHPWAFMQMIQVISVSCKSSQVKSRFYLFPWRVQYKSLYKHLCLGNIIIVELYKEKGCQTKHLWVRLYYCIFHNVVMNKTLLRNWKEVLDVRENIYLHLHNEITVLYLYFGY